MKFILFVILCAFLLQESMQKPARKTKSLDSVAEKGLNRDALEKLLKGKSARLGCDDDDDDNSGKSDDEDDLCLVSVFLELLGILDDDGDISIDDTALALWLIYFVEADLAKLSECKEASSEMQNKCEKVKEYTNCVDKYVNSIGNVCKA